MSEELRTKTINDMDIRKFLEQCRVNPDEKIDTSDDSFWKLEDLIRHYVEDAAKSSDIIDHVSESKCCESCKNFDPLEKSCEVSCVNWSGYER